MRCGAATLLAFVVLAGSPGCARTLYNFGEVHEGQIYRSGQPSPLFLRWLVSKRGVRTLINLRGRTPGFESAFAAHHGLRLYSFNLSASRPPSQDDVERFLRIVRDPANHPLLVHCRNGVDRTGYMVGLVRTTDDGWTVERATNEMNRYLQFSWLNSAPQRVLTEHLRAED
ncbi:MAG: dual specificity protein phosphatase family protein [bacterium]|nr:dual specificity protein phosphatase family protein [bacterium]